MAARWVLLCRFPALGTDNAEAEEPAADFSVALRAPPRVTFLTAARRVHPNPNYIDPAPYLLAAGPSGALFSFATAPDVDDHVLVVAGRFLPAAASGGQQRPAATSTASADLIPKRAAITPLSYSTGLISLNGGARYVIAELQFCSASRRAKLFLFFAGNYQWLEEDLRFPVEAQGRPFVILEVIAHDGDHLWWVDLSWGLLSCNPVSVDEIEPALLFHTLPPGRAVHSYYDGLHDERCICESNHKLRFVEIIRCHDSRGRETAASVTMWTRIPAADASGKTARWDKKYEMSFAEIWNDDSYKATLLPAKVPAIVLVSPSDPNLVYFFLEKRLFGVNVPAHQVVEFVTEQLPGGDPEPPTVPASYLRVLPWILPPSISHDLVEVVDPFQERCASTAATPERMH